MGTFAVENFGCRAARADGEAAAAELRVRGLTECGLDQAAVIVVNTCSVTAEADREARAFVRRVRRRNPEARVVMTGCYEQRAPEEVAALEGVLAVVGNSHKGLLPEIVERLARDRKAMRAAAGADGNVATGDALIPAARLMSTSAVWADDAFAHAWMESAGVAHWSAVGGQTRPNLKIQEGCGNRCSFCVIPWTRGGSRSMAANRVLDEVRGFVAAGGRELVLSGINLGHWGRELKEDAAARMGGLAWLVRRVLDETSLERVRLSSIEPMDWTPELIAVMAEHGGTTQGARVARHAHLPLQSGSDGVLRRMHRRYRPWHYAAKVQALMAACGDELALGADVMVGFPGETDAEFEESLRFVESLPFAYLHVFPFSARPGTEGWRMHADQPVASAAVKERMVRMRAAGASKAQEFHLRMHGRRLCALTLHTPEHMRAKGRTLTLTENFLELEVSGALAANERIVVVVGDAELVEMEAVAQPATIT